MLSIDPGILSNQLSMFSGKLIGNCFPKVFRFGGNPVSHSLRVGKSRIVRLRAGSLLVFRK
jgi:hypothetical protein